MSPEPPDSRPSSAAAFKSRDEIAAAYDSPPWWYDVRGFMILTFAYNSTLGRQLRLFAPNVGAEHLEVACGTGTLLEMVLRWRRRRGLPVNKVVGVDYAESMLAGAISRFSKRPEVEFQHADAASLPFPDNAFDTVNIANSVHCFPDVRGALMDVHRVLKPGGALAANVLLHPQGGWPLRPIAERINAWGMRKGILVTPYAREEIRGLLEDAGFHVEREAVSGNCYEVLARKPA
jgi:ubiquinone/menaquinone biosynthesis C-methylase UbiE